MVVREPAGSENLARPTAIRIDSSRFDVSASDSVTGSHRLHFERWSGTYTPGAPARLTLDLDATSIVAESRWVTDVVRSDLLEAHRFPTIRVDVNLEAVPGSSPEARLVTGNVTLHGLTRAIRFDARTTEDAKGARIMKDISRNDVLCGRSSYTPVTFTLILLSTFITLPVGSVLPKKAFATDSDSIME